MTTAVMMTPPLKSTPFDDAAARREGWLIAGGGTDDAGRQRRELQRLDDSQDGEATFPDDGDAWKHVAGRAGADRRCICRPWRWSTRSSGR